MLLSRNANIDSAPKRTVAKETADGEMEIKINGPALSNDDSLINRKCNTYTGQCFALWKTPDTAKIYQKC